MTGFAVVLVLAGCEGSGRNSDLTVDGGPLVGPDVIVAPMPGDPVVVPCDGLRVVRIENRGDEDHRVDVVAFTTDDPGVSLQTALELPRVVRAGAVFDLEVRIPGAAAGPVGAHVVVTSDEGTVETDLQVEVGLGEARVESFVVGLPKVDVLLAVDHSGTMSDDYLSPLSRGVPGFLDRLDEVADWQLILVTDGDGCRNGPVFSDASTGADFVVDHAFDGAPDADGLTEALLELASRALAENAPPECNAEFLRPGSRLHVIAISDEPEQSGRSASYWVSDFETYAPDVTVSAIVDEGGDCGDGGDGYVDAADQTGGTVLDICTAWGPRMEELADALPARPPSFVLAEDALPGSVVVRVDGEARGASYDPGDRTVTLDRDVPVGTTVEVSYAVPGVCPV